jgi:hypothetical protein
MKCSASVYHGSPLKQMRQFGLEIMGASSAGSCYAGSVSAVKEGREGPLLILVNCDGSGRKFIFASPALCTQ